MREMIGVKSGLVFFFVAVFVATAGPQSTAGRFLLATPGYQLHFPQDHDAHPGYANEWWYFTGNLFTSQSQRFGFELTLFRISPFTGARIADDWFFAHFAVTDVSGETFTFHERARRGAWGQAGVLEQGEEVEVWNENWRVTFDARGPQHLSARWGETAVDLVLTPDEPMLNGNAGWSQKGNAAGEASYYYSYPRLVAKGAVSLARGDYEVTGNVWMDHEFGSAQLAANQIGWDWIGLQLNTQSGAEVDLMSFNLRDANGRYDPHSAGTLRVLYDAAWRGHDPAMREGLPSLDARPQSRFAGGASQKKAAEPPNSRPFDWAFHAHSFTFTPVTYWRSPHTGANYPIGWHFEIPQRQLKLDIHASVADQELLATATGVEYWEGAVDVTGSLAGETLSGSGYLEMTGYARPFEALRRR